MLLSLNNKVVHIDNNNLTTKNITVQTISQRGTTGMILDKDNTEYLSSLGTALSMKTNHTYTIAILSVNGGNGIWIKSATDITNETGGINGTRSVS